jgi:hypothetical protein
MHACEARGIARTLIGSCMVPNTCELYTTRGSSVPYDSYGMVELNTTLAVEILSNTGSDPVNGLERYQHHSLAPISISYRSIMLACLLAYLLAYQIASCDADTAKGLPALEADVLYWQRTNNASVTDAPNNGTQAAL